jgi:hypothetical protein
MTEEVTLTFDEAMAAIIPAAVQIMRRVREGRGSDHGGLSGRSIRDRWGDGINGYMGQLAACKASNMYWSIGGGEVSDGDVGGDMEVRTTHYSNGHLLIYKKDPDDKRFIHVTGEWPNFKVYKPIKAGLCKLDEFWEASFKPPCWKVPCSFVEAA